MEQEAVAYHVARDVSVGKPVGLVQRRDSSHAFGKTMRVVRHEAGLTQEGLAAGADMNRTYPSLLERGLRNPTLVQILNLAAALSIRPGLLVDMAAEQLRKES